MSSETEKFIKGRSQKTATILLAAAAQLEVPKHSIRTQMRGYMVPTEVAERYEELLADFDEANAEPEGDAEVPAEKPAPRKRTTKKTAAKKAAATKTEE